MRSLRRAAPTILLALLAIIVSAAGPSSPPRVATLLGPPPPAPDTFTAVPAGDSRIDLHWSAVTRADRGVDHYNVYRDHRRIAQPDSTDYADGGLRPDTEYTYAVAAVDGKGREGDLAWAKAETTGEDNDSGGGGDSSAPSTPTGLSASVVGSGRIDLTWNAATDPESGISHYRVYRDDSVVATPGSTSYSDLSVNPGTTYIYEVSAVNGDGVEGGRSTAVTVSTPSGGDSSPPGKPTGLTATAAGPRRIDLSWTAASDPGSGIREYVVYRDDQQVGRPSGTTYSDADVQPSTTYRYEVSAVNGSGLEGQRSDPATATTPSDRDASPPGVPPDLTATAESSSRVRLSWGAAQDPQSGISGYYVYRDGAEVAFRSGTDHVDSGLTPDTRYRYRVSAVNGDGVEGNRSPAAEVRTPPAVDTVPPAPPTGLRIVP